VQKATEFSGLRFKRSNFATPDLSNNKEAHGDHIGHVILQKRFSGL
jgi:hypothetical protein